ncbi:glycine zipper domain-containing protein [Phenylobacterium sp.]|uniref:glycine zipper domain-containing protein n=1 Tax=Phenylobacterium sp. TaxID=1871053 RepID=UPI00391C318C
MPPKTTESTPEEVTAAAANDVARLSAEAQRVIGEAATRIEAAVQEGLEQLRAQSRVYADAAGQHLEDAGEYVSDQVRARPLAATGLALGVGVAIGLLLAQAGRR